MKIWQTFVNFNVSNNLYVVITGYEYCYEKKRIVHKYKLTEKQLLKWIGSNYLRIARITFKALLNSFGQFILT